MGGLKRPAAVTEWNTRDWREESDALRSILLACDLDERIKWGKRCYAIEDKNIAIIQKMKAFIALMYFKGSLLSDEEGVLLKPGESSRIARRFEFTSAQDIADSAAVIKRYTLEAIDIERRGLTVPRSKATLVLPDELLARFKREPALEAAFEALTPGRQRGYNLYFSAPKSAEARERRIEKFAPKILAGRGFHDR